MKIHAYASKFLRKAVACSVAVALVGSEVALAATDLSDMPLASSSTATVRPNILYVLDDSGSMDWLAMPDEMVNEERNASWRSHLCNTIYYNPNVTYVAPPSLADGSKFPDQSFTSAKNDGYNSASGSTNLSTSFRANSEDNSQPAYYYVVNSNSGGSFGPLDDQCRDSESFSNSFPHTTGTRHGVSWRKVRVTSTSGPNGSDERVNFANWYSYYRNRLMMMKAATGRSFVELNESYRVGFITINPNSPVTTSKYLKVSDFDQKHKQDFLDKLYSQSTNGSTPLREALSRAGWIFAGKLDTGLTRGISTSDDPVQYACQQNFAILTTDGYWNGDNGQTLDGNDIGQQDGSAAETTTGTDPDRTPQNLTVSVGQRPVWDGGYDSIRRTGTITISYFITDSGCSSRRERLRHTETFTGTEERLSGGVVVSTVNVKGDSTTVTDIDCTRDNLKLPNPSTVTKKVNGEVVAKSGGGSSHTLADVAQYYYKTDLRPDDTKWPDKVPALGTGSEDDRATWQHMTTFTLGLGLFGTLKFDPNYKTNTDPTTDFNQIRSGSKFWPNPASGSNEKADDLWHTAVNGRGQAFTATNPDEIVSGLTGALSGVNARVASAAAAATSNLEPVAGDNFAYTASYETVKWQGELQAREIDLNTGFVSDTPTWSAAEKLNGKVSQACDNRVIYLFRAGTSNNLVPFKWNTDACDLKGLPLGAPETTLDGTEQAFFDKTYVDNLSQWIDMTDGSGGTADQKTVAAGANLVNFIRGQRGKEGFVTNDVNRLYRQRENILGDIVNAQPLFVRRPFAEYLDDGYAAYKKAQDGRTPMVYVAANDGMLHAFYAGTSATDTQGGEEAWAFIPSMVLPELHRLADRDYASLHRFNVDGTPVAGDVYDPATKSWKTILVAGLNKGGRGYYALDITDPATPKALWEFKYSSTCYNPDDGSTAFADCNLGYTFGNPVIAKLTDGRWVVFVTSGYNNVNGAASDGEGFLYVLDPFTGKILRKIGTGVGDSSNPSGLGKISAWVDSALTDNTAQRVYGVDLLGNVWRFDVNDEKGAVQLLATTKDSSGTAQSITTKPELAYIGFPPRPHVYVATGRYLGASDIGDKQTQSIYAIYDPLVTGSSTTPVHADLRTALGEVKIVNTDVGGALQRTATCGKAGACPTKDGWFADFPDEGERINVDMKLQLGTLTVLTNVPQNSACNIGGYSYINFFDYASGLPITGDGGVVGEKLADSLAVGLNILRLPDGRTVAVSTTSDSSQRTSEVPVASPAINGRRVSWREVGE